ncbi:microtubule integrity protein mal3 [Binucleata daphniae]
MNSKRDLLSWLNQTLDEPISKIEDLGRGIHYNLLFYNLDHQYPLRLVNKNAKTEHEYIKNLKICQEYMTKQNIVAHFPVNKICKCKLQDNLEFIQWFYKFYEARKVKSIENSSKTVDDYEKVKEVKNQVMNKTQKYYYSGQTKNNEEKTLTNKNNVMFGAPSKEIKNYKPSIMVNMEKNKDRKIRLSKAESDMANQKIENNNKPEINNKNISNDYFTMQHKNKYENNTSNKIENNTSNKFEYTTSNKFEYKSSNKTENNACNKYEYNTNNKPFSATQRKHTSISNNPEIVYKKDNTLERILNDTSISNNNKENIALQQSFISSYNTKRNADDLSVKNNNQSTIDSFCNLKIVNKECENCKKLEENLKNYKSKEYYLEEKVKYYDKKMAKVESIENNVQVLQKNIQILEKQCIIYENMINETKNDHNKKIETLSDYIEKFQVERDFYFRKIKEIEIEVRKGESRERLLEVLYRK